MDKEEKKVPVSQAGSSMNRERRRNNGGREKATGKGPVKQRPK